LETIIINLKTTQTNQLSFFQAQNTQWITNVKELVAL